MEREILTMYDAGAMLNRNFLLGHSKIKEPAEGVALVEFPGTDGTFILGRGSCVEEMFIGPLVPGHTYAIVTPRFGRLGAWLRRKLGVREFPFDPSGIV